MNRSFIALSLAAFTAVVSAAPTRYVVDPDHTHPSFEVDHFGGLSTWRGIFGKTTGTVSLDTAEKSGSVDITVDTASVEFANAKLNAHVSSAEMLDVAKFPTATYKGVLAGFEKGVPTRVTGSLTLHGVTKPVDLTINTFKCIQNPMTKKDVCGADATGTFSRADFGVSYGQQLGFKQEVLLRIQIEAIKAQ